MIHSILLVDDDPDDQYIFNNALKVVDRSILLSIAKDGVYAFEKLQVVKPDLIFLDINMPRMNGIEFLTKIRSLNTFNQIPIIVYSTTSNIADKIKVKTLGAKDCIEKPILFEDTVDIIRRVIGSFRKSLSQPA
jgi:CheY-like chemotaxis protein